MVPAAIAKHYIFELKKADRMCPASGIDDQRIVGELTLLSPFQTVPPRRSYEFHLILHVEEIFLCSSEPVETYLAHGKHHNLHDRDFNWLDLYKRTYSEKAVSICLV